MTVRSSSARQWEPYAGIAYVVFFAGSVVVSGPPADNASDQKWIANYTGHSRQVGHLATGILLLLAGLALMTFLVALWRRIADADPTASPSRLPIAAAGTSAACMAAGGMVMAYISGGEIVGHYPLPSVDLLRMSNDLGFALAGVAGAWSAAVAVATLSVQGHAVGVFGARMRAAGVLTACRADLRAVVHPDPRASGLGARREHRVDPAARPTRHRHPAHAAARLLTPRTTPTRIHSFEGVSVMKFNRKFAAIATAGILAGVTPVAAYATGGSTGSRTGTVHIWVTPGQGAVDKIILTGVIGDFGTATSITRHGKVDVNGNYVRVVLRHGSFKVNAVAFNKKGSDTPPHINQRTCSVWASFAGNVSLFHGTGAYAGITGKVRITTSFAVIGPRFRSGAHKGKCNLGSNAAPLAEFDGQITGSGKITVLVRRAQEAPGTRGSRGLQLLGVRGLTGGARGPVDGADAGQAGVDLHLVRAVRAHHEQVRAVLVGVVAVADEGDLLSARRVRAGAAVVRVRRVGELGRRGRRRRRCCRHCRPGGSSSSRRSGARCPATSSGRSPPAGGGERDAGPIPSAFMIQTWEWTPSALNRLNAMRVPSGDTVGLKS